LGTWLALEMKDSNRFHSIDLVVSVPLHKKRLKERGYNQVSPFAKAIANVFDVPYEDSVLIKTKHVKTQVFQTKA